jgi:hypothetical protein
MTAKPTALPALRLVSAGRNERTTSPKQIPMRATPSRNKLLSVPQEFSQNIATGAAT